MKTLKTTYWILPLLALNLTLGVSSYAARTDGRDNHSKKGAGCDIEAQMNAFKARNKGAAILSGSCDFTSADKLSVGKDKYPVTGTLKVVRRQIEVKAEEADDGVDLLGRKKDVSILRKDNASDKRFVFEATLTFASDADVSVDTVRKTFMAEDINSVNEIVSKMKGEFSESMKQMQKDINDNIAKEKREKLIADGHEKCMNDEAGKAYKTDEKMNCHKDRLASLDGKDAVNYYNKNLKQQLESLVFRGDGADRDEAVAILEGLSEVASIKKSVTSLQKSVTYQSQIENLALRVQAAGNNTQEKRNAQQALLGLKQQMQQDRDMSAGPQPYARGGQMSMRLDTTSLGSLDAQRYSGLLENNMKLAFLTPDKFFQTMGAGSATGQPATEVDPNNRMARGNSNMPMNQQGVNQMPGGQAQGQIMNRPGMPPTQMMQRPPNGNMYAGQQPGMQQYQPQQQPFYQNGYSQPGYAPQSTQGLRPVFRPGVL